MTYDEMSTVRLISLFFTGINVVLFVITGDWVNLIAAAIGLIVEILYRLNMI